MGIFSPNQTTVSELITVVLGVASCRLFRELRMCEYLREGFHLLFDLNVVDI